MTSASVQLKYQPRAVFMPFHSRTQRWAVMICHRRRPRRQDRHVGQRPDRAGSLQ